MQRRKKYQVLVLLPCLLAVCVLAAWLSNVQAAPSHPFLVPSRYFPETGHNVGGPFLACYDKHGGETLLGQPLTEVIQERGRQVQYFEHMALEMSAGQSRRVSVVPLGEMMTRNRLDESAFVWHQAGPTEVSTFFASTGHNLSYGFRAFWEQHGGDLLFGTPISEAFIEHQSSSGNPTTVQYFERSRLEYRLDHPGGQAIVQPGDLGKEYATQHLAKDELAATRPITTIGTAEIHFSPFPGDIQNISLAARQFDNLKIFPDETVSYLETVGELSVDIGYVAGSGIVNGSYDEVIAGGICFLSTALFQAVVEAGLEVIERHPHTVLLPDLREAPGLDSAVFTSDGKGLNRDGPYDLDLRWRNDLPEPIIITTSIITSGKLTVSLWGYNDGRQTMLSEPVIAQSAGPGSVWRYDASLPLCNVTQVAQGVPGMRVTVERTVRDSADEVLHQDQFLSFYTPFKDVFVYGPGVTPIQDGSAGAAQEARTRCLQAQQTGDGVR